MLQSPGNCHRELRFVLHVLARTQEIERSLIAAATCKQHYTSSNCIVALIPAPGVAICSRDRLTLPMDQVGAYCIIAVPGSGRELPCRLVEGKREEVNLS